MATSKKLTPKQERFVAEYLKDLNATQATIRAGYKSKRPDQIGYEHLRKPEIQAALAEARNKQSERTELEADQILRELAMVGFADIGNYFDFSGQDLRMRAAAAIPAEARRAISSIKIKRYVEKQGEYKEPVEIVEFRLCSKIAALEKLGKHLGLFPEKHELTGEVDVNCTITLTDSDRQSILQGALARLGIPVDGSSGTEPVPQDGHALAETWDAHDPNWKGPTPLAGRGA
jgi:phage terminase small subunit